MSHFAGSYREEDAAMFVSEGIRDRWRTVSSAHAQSLDETEMMLSSRLREDMYAGNKLMQFPVDLDQMSLVSNSKNDM